jgi:hypothetical protein
MKTAESHNAELTGCIHILPMPPLPPEAWQFIEDAQKAMERASASNELLADLPIKGRDPQT